MNRFNGDGLRRRLPLAGAVAVVAVLVAGLILFAGTVGSRPAERGLTALRHAVPPGDAWAQLNRVSDWPPDWTAAVCKSPVYWLRAPHPELPHAIRRGACEAKIAPGGEYFDVTLARFHNELQMQVDLQNNGYELYAFAYDQGSLLAYAIAGSAENMDVTIVLQPLEQYGFNVYHSPGP